MMQQLKQYGINTETLSVAKKHYDDMAMVILEERLSGPQLPLLIDELLQLKIIKDKVDHPRKGSKDLADATCGAIFNAISLTRPEIDREIEIHTYDAMGIDEKPGDEVVDMIHAPQMPKNLEDTIGRMMTI